MDTAQPAMAAETDPNAAFAAASDAFKSFDAGEPIKRPRDEQGRFAATSDEPAEEEGEEPQEADTEAEVEDGVEAADDEPAQPMPPSWPAEQAEHWNTLPPETREFILNREGERERAVQTKFQEAAIARKEATLERQEAANHRQQLLDAYEAVSSLLRPVEPDPRAYGLGTGQYNREAYDLAMLQYRQESAALENIQAQRKQLIEQSIAEEKAAWNAQKQEKEAQFAPKFLADVPDLKDPAKAEPLLHSMIDYAIKNGIDADTFAPERQEYLTSAELHILWKAQQYDLLKNQAPAPKPKQAGPVVRPGVSSPRSAQKAAQRSRAFDRLDREGSIEAGAAVFKNFMT